MANVQNDEYEDRDRFYVSNSQTSSVKAQTNCGNTEELDQMLLRMTPNEVLIIFLNSIISMLNLELILIYSWKSIARLWTVNNNGYIGNPQHQQQGETSRNTIKWNILSVFMKERAVACSLVTVKRMRGLRSSPDPTLSICRPACPQPQNSRKMVPV